MTQQVTISNIDVENSRSCQYDYLSLRFPGSSDRKYCGTEEPEMQEGLLPMSIILSSDGSVNGDGFSLSFQG